MTLRLLDDPGARQTALRVGYRATDWNERPDYGAYTEALSAWSVRLLADKKEPVGAVYTLGSEFHVSVLPEWRGRWATRGLLKKIIPEPEAVTRVTPGHEHVGGLLERLGFEAQGDGIYTKGAQDGN
ncbi:MAG: hypothetical protein HRT82_15840 [Henriciella sp.]|nr:hypothetical protein [Henriciella sp.]